MIRRGRHAAQHHDALGCLHEMTWNFLKWKDARYDYCVQEVTVVRSAQKNIQVPCHPGKYVRTSNRSVYVFGLWNVRGRSGRTALPLMYKPIGHNGSNKINIPASCYYTIAQHILARSRTQTMCRENYFQMKCEVCDKDLEPIRHSIFAKLAIPLKTTNFVPMVFRVCWSSWGPWGLSEEGYSGEPVHLAVRENVHVFQQEFHDIPEGAHHRRCEGFLEKPNAGDENCNIGMIKEQRE
ncbi:Uncharacterized protein HZ326_8308 [Fusarium oxysporum f. sp. albedinis]|nr:Uncharacterized protein HZ326_8308 [Fusarium oxysporum f. sp. albedinis]